MRMSQTSFTENGPQPIWPISLSLYLSQSAAFSLSLLSPTLSLPQAFYFLLLSISFFLIPPLISVYCSQHTFIRNYCNLFIGLCSVFPQQLIVGQKPPIARLCLCTVLPCCFRPRYNFLKVQTYAALSLTPDTLTICRSKVTDFFSDFKNTKE